MPNPITTVEFRFDRESYSKDGIFFQGPMRLLTLPEVGEMFDLDLPIGMRGRVTRREVQTLGRFTEVILHCEAFSGKHTSPVKQVADWSLARFVRFLAGRE